MDRALFEKALKEVAQREGLTPEERKQRCGELLVQAQYMDSKEYLRWMNDSTKRPWVGLTDDDIAQAMYRADAIITGPMQFKFAREVEDKLKEENK